MMHPAIEAEDKPSLRVVEQRVGNRVIEYLELASSFAVQQEYERHVPLAHVPYEVINQWEDWSTRTRGKPQASRTSTTSPRLKPLATSMRYGKTRLQQSRLSLLEGAL